MGKVLGRTLFAVTICAVMFNRSQLSWKMACRHYFCLREKYAPLSILTARRGAGLKEFLVAQIKKEANGNICLFFAEKRFRLKLPFLELTELKLVILF